MRDHQADIWSTKDRWPHKHTRNAQEARRLDGSRSRVFQKNRFEAALRYFEQAYPIAPRVKSLYNIGRAAEEARGAE